MRRGILTIVTLLGLSTAVFAFPGQTAAVNIFGSCGSGSAGGQPAVCKDAKRGETTTTNPLVTVIADVIIILSYLIGAAAIIGIIVSGIRFIMANGEPSAIATARSALFYSLIGLAVAALAQTIARILIAQLT